MDLVRRGLDLATDPRHTRWLVVPLVLADAVLSILIVWKIPYTEIDWRAYMEQVSQYISGERDYARIYGGTGPLVYPAAHVYIYRALHAVTDGGRDIARAQTIFGVLYLCTLALVLLCYRRAGAPPYLLPLLVLSKRLHSIFLLRLFNDGFAVMLFWLAVYFYQRRWWTLGSFALSFGIGVKMSLLLTLPAVGLLLWQALGLERGFQQAMLMGQLQVILGFPFLTTNWWSYLSRAFELSRQFLFKWTVNWRFVGEATFTSRGFAIGLLCAHAGLLLLFSETRWLHVSLGAAIDQLASPPSKEQQARIAIRVHPESILTTMLTAVIIGCLCARSLHYQFYAYIFWSTPFLLWRAGLHPAVIFAVVAAQEWAWNVYPSTDASSMVAVGCLAVTVVSVWVGTRGRPAGEGGKAAEHQK